jgi:CelD/BcsL family acetyltransferase involved in cellulose biosynthesis
VTTTPLQHETLQPESLGLRAVAVTGTEALEGLGPRLDELQAATGCPVTARRPWQQTWLDHYRDHEPLVVAVVGGDNVLRAAAPLAVQRRKGLVRVVPIGAGPSDVVRFPSLEQADAFVLAGAVSSALRGLRRPWLLVARQLDPADGAVAALQSALRWSRTSPGDVSPRLTFKADRSVRGHVSRNHHQQVQRMRNRLSRDGLAPETTHLRTPAEVAGVWSELEHVCRARDVQLRGFSDLDDPRFAPFFRSIVTRLAARDEVRLTTVRVRGALTAYVLSFQDGSVRRMWNCRLDPELQQYGVGRLANHAALEEALADSDITTYDWMRGEEPYKTSMSDHTYRAADLVACSHRALWAQVEGTRLLRDRLRAARDRGGLPGRLVAVAQPLLQRFDRIR